MSKSPKVLFLMSGSIAAFKACQAISQLVKDGADVQVAATDSAFKFIGKATLEGLTGKPVATDLWEEGRAMDHIHLARWADLAVLCPASANTIAKMAHGMADDLVTTLTLAWEEHKPFHVFPAMNHVMFNNEATQKNLKRLRKRGFRIADTGTGALACGEEGEGRLLEAQQIVDIVKGATEPRGKILITAGATREPIDGIRFISNVSTGQTGAELTDRLRGLGWDVTYLHGVSAQAPARPGPSVAFTSYLDLDTKLREELGGKNYDAVIHAAAVSDYTPENADDTVKMKTENELQLKLKGNPKILPQLKSYSANKKIRVFGFKLTLNSDPQAPAREILAQTVDAVVANDWKKVDADRRRHPGTLIRADGAREDFDTLEELALKFHELSQEGVQNGSVS